MPSFLWQPLDVFGLKSVRPGRDHSTVQYGPFLSTPVYLTDPILSCSGRLSHRSAKWTLLSAAFPKPNKREKLQRCQLRPLAAALNLARGVLPGAGRGFAWATVAPKGTLGALRPSE